jgi:hypothetical protein
VDTIQWRAFLEQWSRAVLASPDVENFELPPGVIESGWLGFPGATEEQIAAAETRLGIRLPPSYRAFLQVTNGWRLDGLFGEKLLPVEEIDWFRVQHQGWIDAWMLGWEMAGSPDDKEGEVDYRHLDRTLAISDVGPGGEEIFLLNPAVQTPGNEWEAWFFANWVPGADRSDSFWELLQAEYRSLVQMSATEARRPRPTDSPEVTAVKLPGLLEALQEKLAEDRRLADHAAARDAIGAKSVQGTIEGLEVVISRVQALPLSDPQALRTQLSALADALDGEAAQVEASLRGAVNPGDLMKRLLNPVQYLGDMLADISRMTGLVSVGGRAQGLRQGASIIRWFLNEK